MNIKFLLSVLALIASTGNATTITDNFVFKDSSNVAIASGSFSYDSSASGTLGYKDLSAFTVNLPKGESYDLTFVTHTAVANYTYFGYDTGKNIFVPTNIALSGTLYPAILSAVNSDFNSGFFFDPLPSQAAPGASGFDGQFQGYASNSPLTNPPVIYTATSLSITAAVPEPESYAMLIAGLGLMASIVRRRKTNQA